MFNYIIYFLDGSTQKVSSRNVGMQGDWLIFGDGNSESLRVRAADVESVIREGLPGREGRTG